MTPAELAQVEAAKVALGKATPGPRKYDCGCFYAQCQLNENGQTYEPPIAEMLEGRKSDYEANGIIIAAAPALTRRVIELEAEVQRLKEWQERAVPYLEKEIELCRSVLGIGICTCEVCNDARRRGQELTALITEVQGGEKA